MVANPALLHSFLFRARASYAILLPERAIIAYFICNLFKYVWLAVIFVFEHSLSRLGTSTKHLCRNKQMIGRHSKHQSTLCWILYVVLSDVIVQS